MPEGLGVTADGSLQPCPETPNCVHTGNRHPEGTEGVFLREDLPQPDLMPALRTVISEMPRSEIVTENGSYIHAEFTSRVFRFVDDFELLVTGDRELIVRSASRVGQSDLGANADRVAAFVEALGAAGLLR